MESDIKVIVTNRKARHDYHIEETLEAGIALQGTEVKSLRLGRVNVPDSYARIEDGEIFLYGLHISPYEQGNRFNHDPLRVRKLLLHKREIRRLKTRTRDKGYTLIPLRLYFRNGRCKVELAVARGKRQFDKREALAKKDAARRIDRVMKDRRSSR